MYCAIAKTECKEGACMFYVPSVGRLETEKEHCVIVSGMMALRDGIVTYPTNI